MSITINGKEYVVSNLKAKHIMKVSKIIKNMEIKLNFEQIAKMSKEMNEENQSIATRFIGIDTILNIVSNLGNAEQDFYELLGDLVGMKAKEIEDLEIEYLVDIINELKTKPGIERFLSSAFGKAE